MSLNVCKLIKNSLYKKVYQKDVAPRMKNGQFRYKI